MLFSKSAIPPFTLIMTRIYIYFHGNVDSAMVKDFHVNRRFEVDDTFSDTLGEGEKLRVFNVQNEFDVQTGELIQEVSLDATKFAGKLDTLKPRLEENNWLKFEDFCSRD